MYDEDILEIIHNDLGKRVDMMGATIVALSSQGYVVNTRKYNKLSWLLLLERAFNDIDSFTKVRQKKLEVLYNKTSIL